MKILFELKTIRNRSISHKRPSILNNNQEAILKEYMKLVNEKHLKYNENQIKLARKLNAMKTDVESSGRFSFYKKLLNFKQFKTNTQNGLYIFGTVGTGKTMLMDLFNKSLKVRSQRVHYLKLMQLVHEELQKLKIQNKNIKDPLEQVAHSLFKEVKVLCIDEFQVTDIADAMILRQLMEFLFKMDITIVLTSNKHPDELYENGIQRESFIRCIELIKNKCEIIKLHSENNLDYRKLLKDSGTMVVGEQKMNKVFKVLSGQDIENAIKKKIEYYGRCFTFEKYQNEVCLLKFKTLCFEAMSELDYLEICKYFHTILITNVKIQSFGDRNVLRRFINLIDALYDHKKSMCLILEHPNIHEFIQNVKLWIKASNSSSVDRVLIDDLCVKQEANLNLFTNDEERFAVDRTFSRLIEMQSLDYLRLNLHLSQTQLETLTNINIKH